MGESFHTKSEQDQWPPDIREVKVLEEEGAYTTVVIDYTNKCVKSFHTGKNNKTSQSRLQLNASPWGIEPLGDNKVLIAVPDTRQVVTLEVTPDLIYVASLNTSERYYNLACLSASKLAACAWNSVDILNMQGKVLQSISLGRDMALFYRPLFMCVSNKGHLLVTDWYLQTVTCVTSEGKLKWKYINKPTGIFSGITTTVGGDILVAMYNKHKVIQLSESGKYVRDVATSDDGLRYPLGICTDKHGSLLVCDSGGRFMKFIKR